MAEENSNQEQLNQEETKQEKSKQEESKQEKKEEQPQKQKGEQQKEQVKEKSKTEGKEKKQKEGKSKEKGNGWWPKIPPETILSPGGMVLFIFSLISEILDIILGLIPIPFLSDIFSFPLEIINMILFIAVTGFSPKSLIIPFIIERIPFINLIPTWVIRMFT